MIITSIVFSQKLLAAKRNLIKMCKKKRGNCEDIFCQVIAKFTDIKEEEKTF